MDVVESRTNLGSLFYGWCRWEASITTGLSLKCSSPQPILPCKLSTSPGLLLFKAGSLLPPACCPWPFLGPGKRSSQRPFETWRGEAAGSCLLGRGLVWRPTTPGNFMDLGLEGLQPSSSRALLSLFARCPRPSLACCHLLQTQAWSILTPLLPGCCVLPVPAPRVLSLCKFCGLLAFTTVPSRGPGTEEELGKDSCELVYSTLGPT